LSFEEGEVDKVPLGDLAENLDSMRKPIASGLREPGNIPYYGASGVVDYVKDYIFEEDLLLVSEDGANLLARKTPIAFSISGKSWVNNHAHVLKFNTYVEGTDFEY
jgi:type I restriction enzyme S subunit